MKKTFLLFLLLLPMVLFATTSTHHEATLWDSDFKYRVFNFVIFAGILYYLLANPIKNFFVGRSEDISNSLKEIERRLQEAKEIEKEAQNRVDDSQKRASKIIEDAKNEAEFLAKKIEETTDNEISTLEKQYQEKMSFEERKVTQEAIDEILSENISSSDISIDETKVVDIISKKVA